VAVCAAMLLCGAAARAEISVTVTINGDLEEMLPLLEFLQRMGPGPGGQAEESPMKVEVHSIHDEEEAPRDAAPAPEPEEETLPALPLLDLQRPTVQPRTAEAGSPAAISVEVLDEAGTVDTMSATLEDSNLAFDLYDSGERVEGGGAIWAADVLLPENLSPGTHRIRIAAYDANGNAIRVLGPDGGEHELSTTTEIEIAR